MTEQLLNQPLESATTETTATTVPTETNPGDQVVSSPSAEQLILGKFKTHDDLAKAYTNLESMLGKKVAGLTPEEAITLKELQGRPKSLEDYKVPEGITTEDAQWFREKAFKLGLSNNDALELMAGYVETSKAASEASLKIQEARHQENIMALQKEWGAAFDQRIALAKEGALAVGGEELINILGEAGLGTHPTVIKALANIGKSLKEDSIPTSQHGAKFGLTPADAKREIDLKMIDKDFRDAYFDARNPGHSAAVAEMERLFTISSGSA